MEQRHFLSLGDDRGLTWQVSRQVVVDALAAPPRERSDAATADLLGAHEGVAPCTDGRSHSLIPAAVLVPLVARETGATVLLTQRTGHLANHAGQISFPGGRTEPGDIDAVQAALRETEEEIGLPPRCVDILGRLDAYVTSTGFAVTPVVGVIHPPLSLRPDAFEVDEIFEVPLGFVLDPANHQRHVRPTADGGRRFYYAIPFERHYIWGATAGMLINLSEALNRCRPS